jgi:hypothetical protein
VRWKYSEREREQAGRRLEGDTERVNERQIVIKKIRRTERKEEEMNKRNEEKQTKHMSKSPCGDRDQQNASEVCIKSLTRVNPVFSLNTAWEGPSLWDGTLCKQGRYNGTDKQGEHCGGEGDHNKDRAWLKPGGNSIPLHSPILGAESIPWADL